MECLIHLGLYPDSETATGGNSAAGLSFLVCCERYSFMAFFIAVLVRNIKTVMANDGTYVRKELTRAFRKEVLISHSKNARKLAFFILT